MAFEKGYNALNNVMAQPINKWSDFKKVLRQLDKPEAKERFETIIIDTVDIAYNLCEQYICSREGVEKVGEIPYGAGYSMIEKEFDEALRSIPLKDYGLVMISHSQDKQFTDENGQTFQKIVPTLPKRAELVVNRMADIIGYSRTVETENGTEVRLYLRGTPRFVAGSRWKYTPNYIEFTYDNLVKAIQEAIEKQEEADGIKAVNEHINVYKEVETLSFEEVKEKINNIINKLIRDEDGNLIENSEYISKIKKITEEHLGKNRKIVDATEDQLEMLIMILADLEELVEQK